MRTLPRRFYGRRAHDTRRAAIHNFLGAGKRNGAYSSAELALMERQFMEVVEWSDASSSSGSGSWELDLGDADEVQDTAEGMWMMSCESDEFGGAGLIESIPMLDDEDEEMFMQALYTPKPPPLARHVGARQKPIGQGFRRASRMFNES